MALMLHPYFEPELPDRFHNLCSDDSLNLRDSRRLRQDGSGDDDTIKEFGNIPRFGCPIQHRFIKGIYQVTCTIPHRSGSTTFNRGRRVGRVSCRYS